MFQFHTQKVNHYCCHSEWIRVITDMSVKISSRLKFNLWRDVIHLGAPHYIPTICNSDTLHRRYTHLYTYCWTAISNAIFLVRKFFHFTAKGLLAYTVLGYRQVMFSIIPVRALLQYASVPFTSITVSARSSCLE